jgi:hypothetical protein
MERENGRRSLPAIAWVHEKALSPAEERASSSKGSWSR